MTNTPPAATGAITRADVLAAIGDTDANATNANALRGIIGRGSMATIQKHLADIRAERLPVLPTAPGAIPAAPAEAVAAIWTAAWAQAQVQTLGRLEAVTSERDAATARAATLAQDLTAMTVEIDTLNEELDKAKAVATAAEQSHAVELSTAKAAQVQLENALLVEQREIEKLTAAAKSAEALALRDAQLKDQAHQSAINHLLDQVAELKSALHSRPQA